MIQAYITISSHSAAVWNFVLVDQKYGDISLAALNESGSYCVVAHEQVHDSDHFSSGDQFDWNYAIPDR